jgi:hypothetical protein
MDALLHLIEFSIWFIECHQTCHTICSRPSHQSRRQNSFNILLLSYNITVCRATTLKDAG